MTSPAAFLAPIVLLFAPPAPVDAGAQHVQQIDLGPTPGWLILETARRTPVQRQVRIEQRVIIRVVPRGAAVRRGTSSFVEAPQPRTHLVERETGECLPVSAIGAVQPARDNRLMLFMRDRRMFSAKLERSCAARDFYSGFYVERNEDGMICVDRDKLRSRTGSKCEIEALRQMVPERD